MSTITKEQEQKIADWLATHSLPAGLGTEESACSIAAINLVLSGKLTDNIPDCMSQVIGRWIIRIQDAMPNAMRNSAEWKQLLPFAAGTGRTYEKERAVSILDWMWTIVLPQLQDLADTHGFGSEWSAMLIAKDRDSARTARKAAAAAAAAAGAAAADAAFAAYTAAAYADAADAAAAAAAAAAADAADAADAYAADAAADAADAAADAADAAAARMKFWQKIDPCALLAALIAVSEKTL